MLLIDIGNTRTKYAIYQKGELSGLKSLDIKDLSQLTSIVRTHDVSVCFYASVKDSNIAAQLEKQLAALDIACHRVETQRQCESLVNVYQEYSRLGVDRWLAMLGARKLKPHKPCIVIDSGTATTIDFFTSDGQHRGGFIAPGLPMMANSLFEKTDGVAGRWKIDDEFDFGVDTEDGVNKASFLSTIGLIENAKSIALNKYLANEEELQVYITGGNGLKLSQQLTGENHYVENLVFHGLASYAVQEEHSKKKI